MNSTGQKLFISFPVCLLDKNIDTLSLFCSSDYYFSIYLYMCEHVYRDWLISSGQEIHSESPRVLLGCHALCGLFTSWLVLS